jgi:hypothetical protein
LAMQKKIRHFEHERLTSKKSHFVDNAGQLCFVMDGGQRGEVYHGTEVHEVLQLLDSVRKYLPRNLRALDMGMGLGGFCLPLALHAENSRRISSYEITGIDSDPDACALATEIAREFPEGAHIRYIQGDFTDKELDLTKYNLLYLYKPFIRGFNEIMNERLLQTATGTIVLTKLGLSLSSLYTGAFRTMFHPFNMPGLAPYSAHQRV